MNQINLEFNGKLCKAAVFRLGVFLDEQMN